MQSSQKGSSGATDRAEVLARLTTPHHVPIKTGTWRLDQGFSRAHQLRSLTKLCIPQESLNHNQHPASSRGTQSQQKPQDSIQHPASSKGTQSQQKPQETQERIQHPASSAGIPSHPQSQEAQEVQDHDEQAQEAQDHDEQATSSTENETHKKSQEPQGVNQQPASLPKETLSQQSPRKLRVVHRSLHQQQSPTAPSNPSALQGPSPRAGRIIANATKGIPVDVFRKAKVVEDAEATPWTAEDIRSEPMSMQEFENQLKELQIRMEGFELERSRQHSTRASAVRLAENKQKTRLIEMEARESAQRLSRALVSLSGQHQRTAKLYRQLDEWLQGIVLMK